MDKIINKKALVECVAEKLDISKKNATIAVDTVFEEIANVLAEGGKADISDVYHQLSILLRSGSSKNILIALRENEIYFDNGSGIANNDGRKMMFVPMNIDQSVKTLEESVMKLCR